MCVSRRSLAATPCELQGAAEPKPEKRVPAAGTIRELPLGMKDLLFVAITVGFFALSWIYVRAAERL
jgi:hypothetical protein